eukprot:545046-Hanusia_phi.AAC.1
MSSEEEQEEDGRGGSGGGGARRREGRIGGRRHQGETGEGEGIGGRRPDIFQQEATGIDLGVRLGGSIAALLYLFSPPNVMNGLLDRIFLKAIDARSEDNWGPDDISPK